MVTVITPQGGNLQSLGVPNDPAWLGVPVFCQWLVEDAAGAPLPGFQGVSMSRAARLVFGL